MGLTGFYQLLKKQGYVPSDVCLEKLRGTTIALDGDFVLYVALHGYTHGITVTAIELARHISKWLDLAKQAGIQTIFVTTGGPTPQEKSFCNILRKRKRDRQKERIDELEMRLTSLVDDIGEEICLRDKICRLRDSNRCISSIMSKDVVEILLCQGFNCIRAKSEADFMLVMLSEQKRCDYVATDDADIIVSGAEHVLRGFIQMLTGSNAVGRVFCRSEIMVCLKLTSDSLLELGTLLSCDYQPAIKNVGPVTAFNMMKKYGSVDKFLQSDVFDEQTKSKKRKYVLPVGVSRDTYITFSARSVDIFRSRPDSNPAEDVAESTETSQKTKKIKSTTGNFPGCGEDPVSVSLSPHFSSNV